MALRDDGGRKRCRGCGLEGVAEAGADLAPDAFDTADVGRGVGEQHPRIQLRALVRVLAERGDERADPTANTKAHAWAERCMLKSAVSSLVSPTRRLARPSSAADIAATADGSIPASGGNRDASTKPSALAISAPRTPGTPSTT